MCQWGSLLHVSKSLIRASKQGSWLQFCRTFCGLPDTMRNILNVAEKNDAAKNISAIMSRGTARRREGLSKFNKIYEYDYNFEGQKCNMIMTSVSGHLLQREFTSAYRGWTTCNPLTLFEAPIIKTCSPDYLPIKNTLEREARRCDTLIIWTDCDREGENIGYEVIEVCTAVKRNLKVYRAKFSQITQGAISQAMARLVAPDKNVSDAVEVRSELDLRIGAAFTRFQTLRLQKLFPENLAQDLISYGSCQFPTMGFVIERYKAIQDFIPEPFWKIEVAHTIDEVTVNFRWSEDHWFDQLAVQVIFDKCEENPTATVEKVESKPKTKWRPLPLDTVELEKLASRKLRITAAETMRIAESLYNNGFISYPRTETNIFPKDLALAPLVEMQVRDPDWGEFAARVLQDGPNPRQGKKTDHAHPPIHPTKYADNLNGNQKRVYELIVRHFLACVSKDAKGQETKVQIDISDEKFNASGLMILEKNYLEVYIYERWSNADIHYYEHGQQFVPTRLDMKDGETSPPNLLTEADLISLMEKHGIGTDATHAEHIETTKKRKYVALHDNQFFVPCQLGMGLAEGYDNMGFNMSKPYLRAELEADLKQICEGTKNPQGVLQNQIRKYRDVFVETLNQAAKIDTAVEQYLREQRQADADVALPAPHVMQTVRPCPSCGQDMVLKERQNGGFYLSCSFYPGCRTAQWFPAAVKEIHITDEVCQQCGPATKKLRFKFQRGVYDIYYPDPYHVACIGGCDPEFLDVIGIKISDANQNRAGGDARPAVGNDIGRGRGNPRRGGRGLGRGFMGNERENGRPGNGGDDDDDDGGDPRGGNRVRGPVRLPDSGYSSMPSQDSGRLAGGLQQRNRENERRQDQPWKLIASPDLQPSQNNDVPYCQCTQRAVLRTVRKEGPNKGRQFYGCDKPLGQGCGFFQWSDEAETESIRPTAAVAPMQTWNNSSGNDQRSAFGGGNTNNAGDANDEVPYCTCSILAVLRSVRKEGPNKGRQFYSCSKGPGQGCNFFLWADDSVEGGNRPNPQPTQSWGDSSRNNWNNGGPSRGRGGAGRGRKSKCGVCGKEGHNRRNCPSNGNF